MTATSPTLQSARERSGAGGRSSFLQRSFLIVPSRSPPAGAHFSRKARSHSPNIASSCTEFVAFLA
jgi:hypothetical protein